MTFQPIFSIGQEAQVVSPNPYQPRLYTAQRSRPRTRDRDKDFAVRLSTVVMIAFAALFGLIAVFLAQAWLNSQAEMRARSLGRRYN